MVDPKEAARLNALLELGLLDTPPSESFDRITRMASQIFQLPIAAVSLTDRDRQWFKSRVGVEHTEIPREHAPCGEVADTSSVLVIPDLAADACYARSGLAAGGIRYYAGVPLTTAEGHCLGALCVLGTSPRTTTDSELAALTDLAAMVMAQIELQHAFGRIDPISRLPNRVQFFEDLEDLGRDDPGQQRIAALVDLAHPAQVDNFTRVMGASHIDALVRESAQALKAVLGTERKAYHVGATQFAFLAPAGAELASYAALVGSILKETRRTSELRFVMTSVIGITPFVTGVTPVHDVLTAAQSAAQDARNSDTAVGIYSHLLDEAHRRRFQLLHDFGHALETGDQLRLVFQPRVDLSTRRCLGAEALLRWEHPTLGPISPGEFIPIVEQSAHARPLTALVLESAVRQLAKWRAQGLDLSLSVNITAANLREGDFFEQVRTVLAAHAVPAAALELEITESAIMEDASQALEHLAALSGHGVRLAIDDFGTGYSSLSYLQQLPVDVVKIDQSFIRELAAGSRESTLVRSMVTLSRDLGFRVVAEGVETAEAATLLEAMQCEEAQGYFFARPLEREAFETWVLGGRASRGQPVAA